MFNYMSYVHSIKIRHKANFDLLLRRDIVDVHLESSRLKKRRSIEGGVLPYSWRLSLST